MGVVTTVVAYILLRRDMKRGTLTLNTADEADKEREQAATAHLLSMGQKRFFAVLIPIAFIADVIAMSLFQLQGGDATALVGGTAVFILLLLSVRAHKKRGLKKRQAI